MMTPAAGSSAWHAVGSTLRHPSPLARHRRLFRLGLMVIFLALMAVFWRPLLLLLCPGLLLVHLRCWRQAYLSDLLPLVFGASIAFWIVSFWFLPYLSLPLSRWAYSIISLTTVLWGIGVWRRHHEALIVFDHQEIFSLLLLGAATALRFSFFWRWPLAPAGADMSMHSYMAALIVAIDGVPSSHYPLLPIDGFGAYPAGFQTLMALMALLGNLPVFRSALLVEVVTLSFLTLAFYRFLRAFWDRQTSAMVALLVTFLPRNPQHFIQWGGDPTLLALAFLVLAAGLLPWIKTRMSLGGWGVCALILAASICTHLIPAIGLFYTMIPVVVYAGLSGAFGRREEMRHIGRNFFGIAVISSMLLVLCLPRLFSTEVSGAEIEWVKHFQQRGSGGAWGGTLGNALVTIPRYLAEKIFGGPFVVLNGLALMTLAYRSPHLAIPSVLCVLTVVGLVINSMYWILPLSYAIYPERVALLLLLPFSLGIAALLNGMYYVSAQRKFVVYLMAAIILFFSVGHNEKLLYKGLIPNTLVTKADMQAMRWIQQNTEPGVVFGNHYGDAGLWIPAIAFRGITDPHLSPFYFDEFRAGSTALRPRYMYVGKKKALGDPISLDEFESMPTRYRKVYSHDGVVIYEIIGRVLSDQGEWETSLAKPCEVERFSRGDTAPQVPM